MVWFFISLCYIRSITTADNYALDIVIFCMSFWGFDLIFVHPIIISGKSLCPVTLQPIRTVSCTCLCSSSNSGADIRNGGLDGGRLPSSTFFSWSVRWAGGNFTAKSLGKHFACRLSNRCKSHRWAWSKMSEMLFSINPDLSFVSGSTLLAFFTFTKMHSASRLRALRACCMFMKSTSHVLTGWKSSSWWKTSSCSAASKQCVLFPEQTLTMLREISMSGWCAASQDFPSTMS